MVAPNIINQRVRAIHAALLDAGWGGKRLPKRIFEQFLAQELGLAAGNTYFHVKTGDSLGLWRFVDARPNPGYLEISQSRGEEADSSSVIHDPSTSDGAGFSRRVPVSDAS